MQITLELPDSVVSLLGEAPERTIYKLIKSHLNATTMGRPITNSKRDAEIADKAVAGVRHVIIANEYNLSIIRVSQIVAQGKAAAHQRRIEKTNADLRNIFRPRT
jgi:pilus assembly protein TadC